MTIQTQAFTPPEFQPLKICTYKPTSKAKNKYFKFIFSVSIRILIEIFVFKLNKFSTLSSQYITYSIYYGCFPGIIFTNQHIYAFLKMNF